MYQIKFKESVAKDLKKIDKTIGKKIIEQIYHKLALNPQSGSALTGKAKGLWRYRINDYRVIYSFNEEELWVLYSSPFKALD